MTPTGPHLDLVAELMQGSLASCPAARDADKDAHVVLVRVPSGVVHNHAALATLSGLIVALLKACMGSTSMKRGSGGSWGQWGQWRQPSVGIEYEHEYEYEGMETVHRVRMK